MKDRGYTLTKDGEVLAQNVDFDEVSTVLTDSYVKFLKHAIIYACHEYLDDVKDREGLLLWTVTSQNSGEDVIEIKIDVDDNIVNKDNIIELYLYSDLFIEESTYDCYLVKSDKNSDSKLLFDLKFVSSN